MSEIAILEPQLGLQSFGGGLEGAQRTSRETALWEASRLNPDGIINLVKDEADARSRDSVQNDGYALGAVSIQRDSIVGAQYRLNHRPVWQVIPGATAAWAQECQMIVENRFRLVAESNNAYLDASGINTFAGIIRLHVASFAMTGEVTASVEWNKTDRSRPCKTCILTISPDRLCNPDGVMDNQNLRKGVYKDNYGQPTAYSIRNGAQFTLWGGIQSYSWTKVAAKLGWGRKQFIHILEQLLPDQSRGVSDMVSVLKQLRMTKRFQEVTLQNAVINASFAAAIESELPDAVIAQALGSNPQSPGLGYNQFLAQYMGQLSQYMTSGNNLAMDGAKIPHLYPGTSLQLKPIGTPGGVGTPFEASLLRHIAAGLNVSYEELSRDYSQVSYSSARTSMANTEKGTRARKKHVADRSADDIFQLWFEEDWNAGNIPPPPGQTRELFYQPLMKEALTKAGWIGSGAGQIDELKETQAAILKVQSGLSTYEIEIAKLGGDYREFFDQAIREQKMIKDGNLQFLLSAKRPLGAAAPAADATSEGS